jgi:hypothetical protein
MGVKHLHALRELTLVGLGAAPVSLTSGQDAWVHVLARSVSLLPGLSTLDVRGGGMWPVAAKALVSVAASLPDLQVLDVRSMVTSPASQRVLEEAANQGQLACTVLVTRALSADAGA